MIKNGAVGAWLAALLLAAVAGPCGAATFSMKRGISLDNWVTWPREARWSDPSVLLPFPEWRRSLGPSGLEALKAAGFDFVRMPVDPAPLMSPATEAYRERLFAEVLDAVRLVNAAGLKVVVDLHLIPFGDERSVGMEKVMADPAMFDHYLDLVRTVARTLSREDPERVALELMNEPVTGCEGAEAADWQERLTRLFAAARASATRLTLVLSGGCWGSAEGLAAVDPRAVPDDNVLWSFHSYAPFLLTHQGASWAGDFIGYVEGLSYPPDAASPDERDAALEAVRARIRAEAPLTRRAGLLAYLDEQVAEIDTPGKLRATMAAPFETVAAWAGKYGVARKDVLLGEFGMISREYGENHAMPGRCRAAYARDMIALAEEHGFGWALWSYGGAFGIVEAFDGEEAAPDVLDMVRSLK